MILINLLPPELRRRHGGISPAFASIVGGGVLNVLLLLLWAFLTFIRVPHANKVLAENVETLRVKTALAAEVIAIKEKIKEFEARRDKIVSLINSKMYWAHTLDDFANRLTGTWNVPGFEVRCTDLTVKEDAAAATGSVRKVESVTYNFNWHYKIVAVGRSDKSGYYMKSFFQTIASDPFWRTNGFVGKPEATYNTLSPKWNDDIQRMIIDNTLEWKRSKIVLAANKSDAAAKATPAAGE